MSIKHITIYIALVIIAAQLVAACGSSASLAYQPGKTQPTTASNIQFPVKPTETQVSTATPLPPLNYWIQPSIVSLWGETVKFPDAIQRVDTPEEATLLISFTSQNSKADQLIQTIPWIFALVAPFPTVQDDVSLADLKDAWAGKPFAGMNNSPLLMTARTEAVFKDLWGKPADQATRILPEEQLLNEAWTNRPSWAIIPFEAISPRWKVLSIDNISPVHKDFSAEKYGLTVNITVQSEASQAERYRPLLAYPQSLPAGNRDGKKMTVLVMTGVTALVRATAYTMEAKGVLYPAQDIGDWLRSADITHISNEVSFYEKCPPPSLTQESLYFCTAPKYIELFENLSVDVIELTGNHNNDARQMYGPEVDPANYSLDLYRQRGWKYYGGGENLAYSRNPAIIEHNGNKLAFIGCNPSGPTYAWATETEPGAAPCDDYEWMNNEITRLKNDGYLPIATFQFFENYSDKSGQYDQPVFRKAAESGAVIVSGSQAHVAKGMEFTDNSFIHYGLGNLFFDQMHLPHTDPESIDRWEFTKTQREFIDRYILYDGKLLNVELLTAMLEDSSKPRPMTSEERAHFLQDIFKASGW